MTTRDKANLLYSSAVCFIEIRVFRLSRDNGQGVEEGPHQDAIRAVELLVFTAKPEEPEILCSM